MEVRNVDIKGLRKRFGMSQEELARAIGVSAFTVRRWEKGQPLSPLARKSLEVVIERELKKKESEWED